MPGLEAVPARSGRVRGRDGCPASQPRVPASLLASQPGNRTALRLPNTANSTPSPDPIRAQHVAATSNRDQPGTGIAGRHIPRGILLHTSGRAFLRSNAPGRVPSRCSAMPVTRRRGPRDPAGDPTQAVRALQDAGTRPQWHPVVAALRSLPRRQPSQTRRSWCVGRPVTRTGDARIPHARQGRAGPSGRQQARRGDPVVRGGNRHAAAHGHVAGRSCDLCPQG